MDFTESVLERFPASKPALVAIDEHGEGRVWHFGELVACAAGLSGALAERGVARGDVVMTLIGNRPEWVLTLLACWRMGAVALPCSTMLRPAEVAERARASGARLCVVGPGQGEGLPGDVEVMDVGDVERALDEDRPQAAPPARVQLAPTDPALIVFTSGTTGAPRGVVHTASYLAGQRLQAERWMGAEDGELVWCTTSTGWSKSARNVFLAPWLTGAAALIHDGRFDPEERWRMVERERVNVLCQAPTEYRMLARRADLRPVGSLRRMVSAGEALGAETVAAFEEAQGSRIADGYGQTETGHVSGNLSGEPVRPGSMGRPLPGVEIRVNDGELQVLAESCPTFFSHYLDRSPGSAGDGLLEGGWWPTGDLVTLDDEGYLWHEGRRDDVIVSSGYRIGPMEVESALASHPAVSEAAAVPAPDEERGAVVRAVVVTDGRPGTLELARELQEHVKAVAAPYKFPRIVEFTRELPRTSSGKLRRSALRQGQPPEAP